MKILRKQAKTPKKSIVGLIEKVKVIGKEKSRKVIARIDTGATIGSIDKKLAKELGLGDTVKKKLVKSSHGSTIRPVKKVRFEIAKRKFNMNFTLADRSKLKYKVLIGQNVLKRNFLIDPNKK